MLPAENSVLLPDRLLVSIHRRTEIYRASGDSIQLNRGAPLCRSDPTHPADARARKVENRRTLGFAGHHVSGGTGNRRRVDAGPPALINNGRRILRRIRAVGLAGFLNSGWYREGCPRRTAVRGLVKTMIAG